MESKKFTNWLSAIIDLAKDQERELPDNLTESFKGWYNAGYTPNDIIDNLDFVLNPAHPC